MSFNIFREQNYRIFLLIWSFGLKRCTCLGEKSFILRNTRNDGCSVAILDSIMMWGNCVSSLVYAWAAVMSLFSLISMKSPKFSWYNSFSGKKSNRISRTYRQKKSFLKCTIQPTFQPKPIVYVSVVDSWFWSFLLTILPSPISFQRCSIYRLSLL